jgi:flagellar protein FlaI
MLAEIELPFSKERLTRRQPAARGNFLSQFPPALQEAAREKAYLSEYLQAIPIDEIGVPDYYPELSKKLEKLRNHNLIYPIEDGLFVHIYPDQKSERDAYIPIEPTLTLELDDILPKVEDKLLDLAEEIGQADEDMRGKVFLDCLDRISTTGYGDGKTDRGKIRMTSRELEGVKYLITRDKMGLGVLQPLLNDPYIEDISCSGTGHVFLEHKVFKSLRTTLVFPSLDGLDDFVIWMGERIKKPVTLRHPIVDAVLPDGSRVNIVYGRDIAKRGSNFTIRKFSKDPLSIIELIEFGTLDYLMTAYLWLAIEEGMNIFVAGATASGKTTTLNALTTFIPPNAKIVSIEDTPELQTPQKNWIREVVRSMSKAMGGGEVNMFDLLKAALRQRPDIIIIGEIRGIEGNIAFQAMQTGHGVMSTFHAASVQKLIQRLTGDPINVPKPTIDSLDLVVIQAAVRGPDGRTVRRVVSVNEIVEYDPPSNTYSFITAFRWRVGDDTFEFPGEMNSYLLEQKVALKRGLPDNKRRLIYSELRKRATILKKLHKRGVTNFDKLFEVLAEAKKQGLF